MKRKMGGGGMLRIYGQDMNKEKAFCTSGSREKCESEAWVNAHVCLAARKRKGE